MTMRGYLLAFGLVLGASLSAWAQDPDYELRQKVKDTPTVLCENPRGVDGGSSVPPPPEIPPERSGEEPDERGPEGEGAPGSEYYLCKSSDLAYDSPALIGGTKAPLVDALSFNHFQTAFDFKTMLGSGSSCAGCTAGPAAPSALHSFSVLRIHRYRDVAEDSSFGPGVYSNFDTKLYLDDATGEKSVMLVDPQVVNKIRFIDGPITHPFNPNDTLDGVYVSFKSNSHKDLRLYDAQGQLTSTQANAATAVLTAWNGQKFHFEIINVEGALAGRMTQVTDPLGRVTQYAYDSRNRVTTVTYNDATTEVFTYGTGADANLLVQETDRLGNTTTYAYDASGRQIERVTAANVPALQAVFVCTYKPGTHLRAVCTDRGNATTYDYDYRNRVIKENVQPNRSGTAGAAKILTTTTTFTNNLVSRVTDPYGRRTHYVYSAGDAYLLRTVSETTPSGTGTTVDTLARDYSLNAKFVIEDRTYDAEGQVLTLVDGRGIEDTFSYDSRGRMTAMVESARIYNTGTATYDVTELGARTEYTYDLQGNRTEVKLPRSFAQQGDGSFAAGPNGNFITKYAYTGRNLLKSVTEAFGRTEEATESYSYWLDKRRKDRIDARGETWTTLWSRCCGFHKVEAQPEADADANSGTAETRAAFVGNRDSRNLVVHEFTVADWAPFPQDPTLADAIYHDPASTLNEVTTKYDARRRPVARTAWLIELGNVAKNDPTIAGTHGTNASDGLTTTWIYDEDLTDATGLDAAYAAYLTDLALGAGSVGSAVEETDPLGNKTVRIFDGIGRLVKTVDPNGNTRKIVYDTLTSSTGSLGNVLQTTVYDGLNKTTKQRVDGIGRMVGTVDPDNRLTIYSYDANANRVKSRDPNGVGMDCVFDARDRETICTDTLSVDGGGAATGDVTLYVYDNHNNLVTTTDAKSQVTTCVYDARDRKVSCTDRNSGVTNWQYDHNSNLTALIDAETRTTTFGYDPRNLKVEEIYPGHSLPSNNERVAFGYDARGRMAFRLDQKDDLTEYAYDRVDRLTTRTYPDTSVDTFTYDLASRLTAANCGRYNTLVERTYDSGSRLTSEKLTVDSVAYTTSSAYDAANRRTSITYPNGKIVAQTFTTRDQLSNVKYDAVNVGTFVYDIGMRRTTLTFGNSKVETRQYRTDDRLTSINTPNVTNFTYTYDANKNPLTQGVGHNTTDNQTYAYDPEDRLVDFQRSGSGPNQAWQLSLVGDWDQFTNGASVETRTHNDVHELTAVNANSLSYDLKGNLTTNSNGQTYAWDFENLMESATVGADTADYIYDAFRRRVKKTFDGDSTVFVYDGWRCISEYDNGANVASPDRLFVFGTYLDEVLMMRNAAGTKYYYHANHLYSVHAITNSAGAIVEAVQSYDAYGKPTILTGAGTDATWFTTDDVTASVSAIGNPWFYTGQRLDAETGLMYYKNRFYSAELGRFVGRWLNEYLDPSFYQYQFAMPIVYTDPYGDPIKVEGSEGFKVNVAEAIKRLKNADPKVKKILEQLEAAEETTTIKQPETDDDKLQAPEPKTTAPTQGQATYDETKKEWKRGSGTKGSTIWIPVEFREEDFDVLLFHEIVHAWRFWLGYGMISYVGAEAQVPCSTGVPWEEVITVNWENYLRTILKRELRRKYGANPLPPETENPPPGLGPQPAGDPSKEKRPIAIVEEE